MHAASGGVVDGGGQRLDERHGFLDRKRSALAEDDVERISDGVFLNEVGHAAFKTRGDRRRDIRMSQIGLNELAQTIDERSCLFRCEIHAKHLDRDQTIAAVLCSFVRTEDRTERARTYLMENPEGAERLWRKVQERIFAVQHADGNMNCCTFPSTSAAFPGSKSSRP